MPYIFIIRDDIPAGVLQTALDLQPNTSQRSFVYDLIGQTGYRSQPGYGTAPTVAAGVTTSEESGLAAWLMDNVSSAAGTAATADITTIAVASLVDGDNFTVTDGENTVTFEFVVTAGYAVASPNVAVDVTGDTTADDVRDTLIALIPTTILNVSAASGGAATVTMTNDNQNQPTADQNATNSEAVANAGFLVANFASATDSDSLTAAEATTDSADIEALVKAGSALTQAGINAALTTGAINKEDVEPILDILASRIYTVPLGTTLEAAGEFVGGGGSFTSTVRKVYDTGALKISFAEGRLNLARGATFTYAGTAGAAVVVYNDDGSVYTG